MGRYNTILQKGDLGRRYEEVRVASGVSIYPGMIFDINASGEAVIATPNAGASAPTRIAIEDGLIGRTVDTPYTAGELLRYLYALPGEQFALLVKDAETITFGDDLIAGDNGLFIETTGTPSKVFARALETYTPTGANKLVLAEIY
jgi:hypothetical protein